MLGSVALGTSRTAHDALVKALKHGIRHGVRVIDTAVLYNNDSAVRTAIHESIEEGTVQRSDLCIINKTFYTTHTAADIESECRTALVNLDLDYIDLHLLHYPFLLAKHCKLSDTNIELVEDNLKERWLGLEKLVNKQIVQQIGVSNFSAAQLEEIALFSTIKPVLNQVECHPYFPNQSLVDYCSRNGITVMAYGPLGTPTFLVNKDDPRVGHMTIMQEPVVVSIAGKHNKTPAQVLLKWAVQRGTVPVVKTTNCHHLEDNLNLSDFEMSELEVEEITGLGREDGRVWRFDYARDSMYWHYD